MKRFKLKYELVEIEIKKEIKRLIENGAWPYQVRLDAVRNIKKRKEEEKCRT
ncbi:unnamed protein product [marine sediment metagenome]|uniref:Uncharacterized protein n=1 Tax=marine sediment metagenome TaxID=412755 RepID=X1M403_9ZZZZ